MNSVSNHLFNSDFINKLPYETPFFLFSNKKIVNNYREFREFFPKSSIHYAMKANSEPGVLKLLAEVGCGFEVASSHELRLLEKIKVSPEKIIYGTSVKPGSHIKDFFRFGVNRFAFDSFHELEKIAREAPGSKVYVRVIANDMGSVFKFSEKFGTDIPNALPLLMRAKELKLHPYGISFHVGSQASNPLAWASTIEKLQPVIKDLKKVGIKLDILNLGGGYPSDYLSNEFPLSLKEIAANTLRQYKKLPYQPKLILEPGRGIIANAGILVVSVIARIERKSSVWLFLDAGVYNGLFEAMAYQGSTRYRITTLKPKSNSGETLFALAGPTGDSPDVITREAFLPKNIEVGDKLAFHNVGAYSLSVTSTFNGFPKPNVYFV